MPATSAAQTLLAGGKAAVSTLVKALMWIVPIVVLGTGVYYLMGGTPPDERLTKPDSFIAAYNAFAQPMAANRQELPNVTEVETFLSFFDEPSRRWFASQARLMSYPFNMDRKSEWRQFTDEMHRMEAMRYLLARGIFSGTARVTHVHINSKTHEANVTLNVRGADIPIVLSNDGKRYYFTRMLGQMESLEKQLTRPETK